MEKTNLRLAHKKEIKQLKGDLINWNQVYYFSEIASRGSIKSAAEELGLSPSTLSEHLAELEKDLELQLFFRRHRKLVLTAEGTRLFLHAKTMFEEGKRLIDVVSPVPLGCYPVSVGLVPCPSIQIAYRLIGDYLEEFGPLKMKIVHARYSELEENLSRARFDFGFSDRVPEHKDIEYRKLSNSSIRFYVSLKLADRRFSDLVSSLPLLICNAEPEHKTLVEQGLEESDLEVSSVVTSDYPSVLVELCKRGMGIGVFSEGSVNRFSFEHLKSLRVPRDAPRLQDQLYVLWARAGENTEAVKRLRESLHIPGNNA